MITKENLCIAVISIIPLRKPCWFFFKRRLFLFKELSKIFKDFCGKFKDFSRISNNFSSFKDFSSTWCFFKDFSRPVRTMPWITQGLCSIELKFYSELLRLVNRDSLKGITSYDSLSPRAIWDKILPTTGAILNPWPRKKNYIKTCSSHGNNHSQLPLSGWEISNYFVAGKCGPCNLLFSLTTLRSLFLQLG